MTDVKLTRKQVSEAYAAAIEAERYLAGLCG